MKRKYSYFDGQKQREREYSYIPVRYILAVLITLFEVLAVIGILVAFCYYVPYFYTLNKSIEVTPDMLKTNLLQRFIRAVVRIFAPML